MTFPTLHEGALHVSRQRIISNRSLLRNANRCGLPQYVQSKPFSPKAWAPLNFIVYRPPRVRQDDQATEIADNGLEEGEIPPEKNTQEDMATGASNKDNGTKVGKPGNSEPTEALGRDCSPIDVGEDHEIVKLIDGQASSGTGQKKPSKKKQKQESSTIQWLGDKVQYMLFSRIPEAYINTGV